MTLLLQMPQHRARTPVKRYDPLTDGANDTALKANSTEVKTTIKKKEKAPTKKKATASKKNKVVTNEKRTTVFLIRHGDRFDFANKEEWRATCKRLGHAVTDPSLSALGHRQARETAEALADQGIEHILVSPYLRVIQTAQPLAHACSLPLCVEEGLAELDYAPSDVPSAGQRVAYFPEINDAYVPLHPPVQAPLGVESNLGYLRRMLHLAAALPSTFPCGTVACFSHAASVGLVAALTDSKTLDTVGTFAPCGIWKLVSDDGGSTWEVQQRGDDNTAHVSENQPSTFPWGFRHSATTTGSKSTPEQWEDTWKEAQCLGHTFMPSLRVRNSA